MMNKLVFCIMMSLFPNGKFPNYLSGEISINSCEAVKTDTSVRENIPLTYQSRNKTRSIVPAPCSVSKVENELIFLPRDFQCTIEIIISNSDCEVLRIPLLCSQQKEIRVDIGILKSDQFKLELIDLSTEQSWHGYFVK